MSKNRIIVETDSGAVRAQVTSSTRENKTRTEIITKNGRFFMKQNIFAEEIPISVVFKAMGIESE